jgi:hypothetical protein
MPNPTINQLRARMTLSHRQALQNIALGKPAMMSRTIQNTLLKWGAVANGEITAVGKALLSSAVSEPKQ